MIGEDETVNMADAAQSYALRGWPTFPVNLKKEPLTEHGFKDASTDEGRISAWWSKDPGAGIGVAVPALHFVLDVDPRHAGDKALAALIAAHEPLPPTVRARTGGGGEHLWFRLPESANGGTLKGSIGSGLDIKAGGSGYVVLPPSPHASGKRYEWLPRCDPEEQAIAEAPVWLADLVVDRRRGDERSGSVAGVAPMKALLAGVPEGKRDVTLYRYACDLRRRWSPRDEAEVLVLAVARECVPPFPDAEALEKVEQAWKHRAGTEAPELTKGEEPAAGTAQVPEAANKVSTAFKVLTARRLLELELPLSENVLGPFRDDEAVFVYARRGVGKSFFALGVSVAIASGGEFLGWKATKPRKVLVVDGELSPRMMQKRVDLACKMLVGGNAAEALDNLTVLSAGINRSSPNIATPEGRSAIEEHLAGVGFLNLDALSTLCRGGEENAAEAWQPVQDWLVRLRAEGVPSMTIHHAGKSGLQRGTSKREDIYDWILALKHPNDYQAHQGARFEVHFEKTRDFPGGALADPFEARIDHDGPKDFWTVKTLETAIEEKVISLHRDGLSNREIGKEVGKHHTTVARILKRAEKGGRLAAPEAG